MPQNETARNAVAIGTGVIVAGIVVAMVEMAGHALFPPPPGLDMARPEDQARLVAALPMGGKVAVVGAWFAGSLAGACTAIALARRILPAWVVGLAIAALGLWTTQAFPHPAWMAGGAVVLPLIAVLVAKALMRRRLGT